jgi:hypothetical protein
MTICSLSQCSTCYLWCCCMLCLNLWKSCNIQNGWKW